MTVSIASLTFSIVLFQPILNELLLVIGGHNGTHGISDVELMDPFDRNTNCKKPKDFPMLEAALL